MEKKTDVSCGSSYQSKSAPYTTQIHRTGVTMDFLTTAQRRDVDKAAVLYSQCAKVLQMKKKSRMIRTRCSVMFDVMYQ